jgi:Zn-dependent peptidase ImmA (M78 family)
MNKPERAAQGLLKKTGVDAPSVDVIEIAKRLGVRVEMADLGSDCSGMLVRGAEGAVIGVHYAHPPNRQRFTIAHELGHFCLHDGGTYVDRGTSLRFRSNSKNSGSAIEEREANQFAAGLLMPADWIRDEMDRHPFDLGDDESLMNLCEHFGVSSQAMIYRLTNLGLLRDQNGGKD